MTIAEYIDQVLRDSLIHCYLHIEECSQCAQHFGGIYAVPACGDLPASSATG